MREKFLVTRREDMERRGSDQLDFSTSMAMLMSITPVLPQPSSAAYWKAGAIVSVSFPSPTGTVPNRSSNWDGRGWLP